MDMDDRDKKDIRNIMEQEETDHNVLYSRFVFNTRHQLDGETLSSYVQNLRTMVQKCNFPGNSDDTVLDRLICGIKDKRLQQFLLHQGNNKLEYFTLKKALEMAEEKEMLFKASNETFVLDQEFYYFTIQIH